MFPASSAPLAKSVSRNSVSSPTFLGPPSPDSVAARTQLVVSCICVSPSTMKACLVSGARRLEGGTPLHISTNALYGMA